MFCICAFRSGSHTQLFGTRNVASATEEVTSKNPYIILIHLNLNNYMYLVAAMLDDTALKSA